MIKRLGKRTPQGEPIAPEQAAREQSRFARAGLIPLLGLTLFLLLIWYLALPAGLDPQEEKLWHRVRAAQREISAWRAGQGCAAEVQADPWQLGFIGTQWSPLTTTLGDLEAKRTACNPAWAIWFKRQFQEMGLEPGDRVALFASASFPGLIVNSLAAARDLELETLLLVSLGASTWGANHPACPWPLLEAELERRGFLSGKAAYYTLGGGDELGRGMPPVALSRLEQAAARRGVPLLKAADLEGVIRRKGELLQEFAPKLLISIGGSRANLGSDPAVLKLPPGQIRPGSIANPGDGVLGRALKQGLPVLHLLNIRKLSSRAGIPYDGEPFPQGPGRLGLLWCGLGLSAYLLVLWFQRRWRIRPFKRA